MTEPSSSCGHVTVTIERADQEQEAGSGVELDAETGARVRCWRCWSTWSLADAPALLVARALAAMLGEPDYLPMLATVRHDPALRRIEVVDLLAQVVELDAHRDAR